MPDVQLAGPLLEASAMKRTLPQPPAVEPLVDARYAARALNLPLYYLTKPRSRELRQVPHYRIGRTIRFRLSELDTWAVRFRQRSVAEEC